MIRISYEQNELPFLVYKKKDELPSTLLVKDSQFLLILSSLSFGRADTLLFVSEFGFGPRPRLE